MITLLHGDDITKSRNELNHLRSAAKEKEVRMLNGKGISDDELVQGLGSQSLFGNDLLVIIENLFGPLGKKLKRTQEIGAILVEESTHTDIILWEDKSMGKTVISSLGKKLVNLEFKLPTIIFQFLDNIQPKATKQTLSLYEELLKIEPPELVHAMLIKRVRQLLYMKSNMTPENMQPWQLGRLTNQARAFTMVEVTRLYKHLLLVDFHMKTGNLLGSLESEEKSLLANVLT